MILTTQEKIHDYSTRGWWGTKTIQDSLQTIVDRSPNKEAVIDPANKASLCKTPLYTLTYQELQYKIDQMASALHRNGIGKDDIVAIQLPNIVELVISYFAILKVGAIGPKPCPGSTRATRISLFTPSGLRMKTEKSYFAPAFTTMPLKPLLSMPKPVQPSKS